MLDLIHKKRQGDALTGAEIDFLIKNYVSEDIPDYQMAAFLMAVYFRGLNKKETAELTRAIVHSGETIDLSAIEGIKVDKHSTGGVGDKVSLIVLPLVAAVGVPVAKMSGRGLGYTGGTIDKLESIPGFKTELTREEFIANVNRYKMAITAQSANLTPADKKLYALRDATDTVDSVPLIASSIMGKKIASGADCIVLDVKVGTGAFMKTLAEARELASTMVEIGTSLGRKTVAVISNMNQPLGHEVGNANEIREAVEVLNGRGPEDLTTVALTVATYMAVLGGAFKEPAAAGKALRDMVASGRALDKLKELVRVQGGDPGVIDDPGKLPQAGKHLEVKAAGAGYVSGIDAEALGIAAMLLGAGRKKKEDSIDHSAGLTMVKKVGDRVSRGDTLCILHTNLADTGQAEDRARNVFLLQEEPPEKTPLIYDVLE